MKNYIKKKASHTPPGRPSIKVKILASISLAIILSGCTRQSDQPTTPTATQQKQLCIVVDYSASYRSLITLDSSNITALFDCLSAGGTIAHIPVQGSGDLPVSITCVPKLDTTGIGITTSNIYQQARESKRKQQILVTYQAAIQKQVLSFLRETRRYDTSAFSDVEAALYLAKYTVCSPTYIQRNYKQYLLVLSDLEQDIKGRKNEKLNPIDVCGAIVLLVRPSNDLSQDSLRKIFNTEDIHTFSNLLDAISFIKQNN